LMVTRRNTDIQLDLQMCAYVDINIQTWHANHHLCFFFIVICSHYQDCLLTSKQIIYSRGSRIYPFKSSQWNVIDTFLVCSCFPDFRAELARLIVVYYGSCAFDSVI
jgi:hypothetical protein